MPLPVTTTAVVVDAVDAEVSTTAADAVVDAVVDVAASTTVDAEVDVVAVVAAPTAAALEISKARSRPLRKDLMAMPTSMLAAHGLVPEGLIHTVGRRLVGCGLLTSTPHGVCGL
jgi:hypothetical protein